MFLPLRGILGSWSDGLPLDFLLRQGHYMMLYRKFYLVLGILVPSCIALYTVIENGWGCLALFSMSYANLSFDGANTFVIVG